MLTAQENELLTRVGPGTPGGELLRRYWHPVAIVPDLSDDSPTRHVRILGEDLVLFRTLSPSPLPRGGEGEGARVGLLADHCAHRGASLLYGRVEERGIACAYHGWLYDVNGNCLETPAEPADSLFHHTVKQRAYPVQERYGLYWAYLGPSPAPVLPRFDLVEIAPVKYVGQTFFDCNWLQVMENHMDQSHVFILHQETAQRGVEGMSTARGQIDELEGLEYREVPLGIKRRQVHKSGYDDADLMKFPNFQRIYNMLLMNVPIDDTHSKRYSLVADLAGGLFAAGGSRGTIDYRQGQTSRSPSKSPPDAIHPIATYQMEGFGTQAQDLMALETQGAIAARESEHLGTSDKGVALFRSLLKREIEKVQHGIEPIAVLRDPDQELIDTYIHNWINMIQRFPAEHAAR